MLNNYLNEINNNFKDWIEVFDIQNLLTIESFPYSTGVIDFLTKPHCWKCVTVNRCWFKNEVNKRPAEFDYSNSDLPLKEQGLYHPNCHCQKINIFTPKAEQIELIITEAKINYLFTKKLGWVEYMGYNASNQKEFLDLLTSKTKEAYILGNYYVENHTKYGFKINLKISIPGSNMKKNEVFNIETNYMIFPNGKLKMNTPLGGWQK